VCKNPLWWWVYAPSSPPDDRGFPATDGGFGGRTGPVGYELFSPHGCGYLDDRCFSYDCPCSYLRPACGYSNYGCLE
jgi:hypothetical protein